MSRIFFDSNILIYAFWLEDPRREIALSLVERGGHISAQCLNEFASVMRGKRRWDWALIREAIARIVDACGEPVAIDRALHHTALIVAEKYRVSVYDALIIAAALRADCDTLYSEDMHNGLVIDDRLRIVNPFDQAAR